MAVIIYGNRTYAETQTMILQMLQDTGSAIFDTTELGYWIEESLKEFAAYIPHIVPVVFQIESRDGSETAGTASSLTDASKSQFLAGDVEKVVHNTTDETWAVVETFSSASVLTLNADIMDLNENYNIYNKRCWNRRQIYIGDVTDYLRVDSVEYPIGTKRNWVIYNDILEIIVDFVADSDSTLSTVPNVDVLVRFVKPHKLNQLTDWSGELTANGSKGDTTIAVDGFNASEKVERGDEFYIQFHRYLYTVMADTTFTAGAGTLTFFPGFEAAVTDNDDIEFVKSTLQPHHEEMFAHLVAARASMSNSISLINKVNVGGAGAWADFQSWGERKLSEVLRKLNKIAVPRTKRLYSRGGHIHHSNVLWHGGH